MSDDFANVLAAYYGYRDGHGHEDPGFNPFIERPSSTMSTADPIPEEYRQSLHQRHQHLDSTSPSFYPAESLTEDNESSQYQPLPTGSTYNESMPGNHDPREEYFAECLYFAIRMHRAEIEQMFQLIIPRLYETITNDDPIFRRSLRPEIGFGLANVLVRYIHHNPAMDDNNRKRIRINYNSVTQRFDIIKTRHISASFETWATLQWQRFEFWRCFTPYEKSLIRWLDGHSTGTLNFTQRYELSFKEPILKIVPGGEMMPRIVFESVWYKPGVYLDEDIDLWFDGGWPDVQVLILVVWSFNVNVEVEGRIQVYKAEVGLDQEKLLFPEPDPEDRNECITINRQDLFGDSLAAGRNPFDVFKFFLNDLRCFARKAIWDDGFVPAGYQFLVLTEDEML